MSPLYMHTDIFRQQPQAAHTLGYTCRDCRKPKASGRNVNPTERTVQQLYIVTCRWVGLRTPRKVKRSFALLKDGYPLKFVVSGRPTAKGPCAPTQTSYRHLFWNLCVNSKTLNHAVSILNDKAFGVIQPLSSETPDDLQS